MELTLKDLKENRQEWLDHGYRLPSFDADKLKENTLDHPVWVHFGAGNIFKAFHAAAAQRLIEAGVMDTGIVAAEGFDGEIVSASMRPHDNLTVAVTLCADGSVKKEVIGSIAASYVLDRAAEEDYAALKKVFENPSLQLCTFTITEKGYSLTDRSGAFRADVEADFAKGPQEADSYIGKVAALLYARFCAGELPVAMVSTDNCSHNGDKLKDAVCAYAAKWQENGVVKDGFMAYLTESGKVSFPWSMIDKITPRPDASVEKLLAEDGFDLKPVITSKNTYIAPFVNAEESEYLVIEDAFPNGRPAMEKAGIMFTDRETVERVETMKVSTCLNPLHTSLAVFGCLLGFTKICDELKDADLKALIKGVGYTEGLPAVVNPGIINPKDFIDTVVNVRFPNPFMPDTPQRIATDTSQKLSVRFGGTISRYMERADLDPANLRLIPLVIAGWLRYLTAVDDEGKAFELSPDPMIETLKPALAELKFGALADTAKVREVLMPLLKDPVIFGTDLEKAGLADRVIAYYEKLMKGPGAVRATLHDAVSE